VKTRRLTVFVVLTFAYLLSQFTRHANAAIADSVSKDISLTAAQLGLMTSLFYVAFAAAQVPLGIALDRLRPRLVLAGMMLASGIGCLVFASARSLGTLASGRALIGLGMAGILMGSFKILARWYPTKRLATVSGLLIGLGALGGLAAASPLVWFNQHYGWRAAFTIVAGVIAASAVTVGLFARDWPAGEASHHTAGGAHAGSVRDVFKDGRFWRLGPLNFFFCGSLMAVQGLWAGPFLLDVHHMTATGKGTFLSLLSLGVVAGYLAGGWLADRMGIYRAVMWSGGLFVATQAVFLLSVLKLVPWLLGSAYFLFGFAGAFQILTVVQIGTLFPVHMTGRAVTAVNMFGFAGTAFLQWIMGVIIGSFGKNAAGAYPPQAYATAFGLGAVAMLAALLWYGATPALRRPLGAAGI
jgi:sugar phosphate permease